MINRTVHYLVKNRKLLYALFFMITAATLFLTLVPSDRLGSNSLFKYDKFGHFMMFFCWTMAFGLLSFSKKGPGNTKIIAIFFIGSLFGISIEILQHYMPFGRTADLYDAIADISGSLTAAIILQILKKNYLSD